MKNIRKCKLTLSIFTIIFFVIYVLVFIKLSHMQRDAFRATKTDILILAGYSSSSIDDVILLQKNGHYYVNGQHVCDNIQITSKIDNLVRTSEDYQTQQALLLLTGIVLITFMAMLHNHIAKIETSNSKENELNTIFLFEQEEIQHKRTELKIYDCATEEETESKEPNSEENESEELNSGENESEELNSEENESEEPSSEEDESEELNSEENESEEHSSEENESKELNSKD